MNGEKRDKKFLTHIHKHKTEIRIAPNNIKSIKKLHTNTKQKLKNEKLSQVEASLQSSLHWRSLQTNIRKTNNST
jgi:hypothetical protein